jgi:Peptidase family C78
VDRNHRGLYSYNLCRISVRISHNDSHSTRCSLHDFDFQKPPLFSSLIKYVEEYFKSSKPQISDSLVSSCRISDRPPLYFQHYGHSRTIVGIEYLKSKKINLLLFDPVNRPSSAVRDYAVGKINKNKDLSESILKPFRISIDELVEKRKYQILGYTTCVALADIYQITGRNDGRC